MRLLYSASVVLFACLATLSCGSHAELALPYDIDETDAGQDASSDGAPLPDDTPLEDGGHSGCKPLTCADQDIECGPAGDGCGGVIECGSCTAPETCGGGGQYSKCGGSSGCVPRTCDSVGANSCGPIADGCGGLIECGSCTAPASCGGGGVASQCGHFGSCQLKTCDDYGPNTCGPQSDGCGGLIDCSSCSLPEVCGGDPAKLGQCAVPPMVDGGTDGGSSCTPRTCDDLGESTCGPQGDGCGGQIDCASDCPTGQLCGGNPTKPGQCGTPPSTCTKRTSCESHECGPVSDGCGGILECSGCPAGQQCGSTAKPGQCVPISQCTKLKCADYPAKTCGQQSDGCGGVIQCGGCTGAGEVCGGDPAKPGQCAVPPSTCVPRSCAELGVSCGPAGNGCGGTIPSCGTCGANEQCGAPGKPSQCVPKSTCKPKTCSELGYTCGIAPDGCGGSVNCWTNPANPRCPGASEACIGNPAQCVAGTGGGGCTGPLCGSIPACGATPTQVSGRVTSPNGSLRVPNAIVYIPRDPAAALPGISTGPSCDRCEDEDVGPTLAAAITDHKGEFTLKGDIPVGVPFNIVVKSGKWRGVKKIDAGVITGCSSKDIGDTYTRLPANKTDGLAGTHLPHVAIATGDADAMECVFYKLGISESEFTNRDESGRVHLYQANGAKYGTRTPRANGCSGGSFINDCSVAKCQGSEAKCRACDGAIVSCTWTPYDYTDKSVSAAELSTRFNDYDLVVWDCEGSATTRTNAERTAIRNFINAGGRLFASHFSSDWIQDNPGLSDIATWGSGNASSATGVLSFARPRGRTNRLQTFARWLDNEGAATVGYTGGVPTSGSFPIKDPRDNAKSVSENAEEWVYRTTSGSATSVQTFSFNTPIGANADNICGRATYSGFHVAEGFGSGGAGSKYFPEHCSGALTNQEKVLAYMLFDLAACVSEGEPPVPPSCTPRTKAEACAGGLCGAVSDGCGKVIECGGCPAGQSCSGANTCSAPCVPKTCAAFPDTCGQQSDGCGGLTTNCGGCSLPETCGGGGVPNKCGALSCQALSCDDIGANCGTQGDGCGGILNCGTCTAPNTCGGAGVPNQCGSVACTKATCDSLGLGCGIHGDGCGGFVECGNCTAPDTCGGGGVPNQCGHPGCVPATCDDQGISCGPAGDGCGGLIANCGSCTWPETCGGGGVPGQCGLSDGGFCEPISCDDQGLECGPAGNGCGGVLACGTCKAPDTCGGGGVPGQCGHRECIPKTCEDLEISCGPAGDGCGNTLACGTCKAPDTCGGGGVPGQCGKPDCTPRTCKQAGVECGSIGDGCGGIVECGTCKAPNTCGGGGKPGICGGGVK